MILLTRFHRGDRIAVNPELIERIEETPDTVITLTNGTKHVVDEGIDEIIQRVLVSKATTLALANRMADDPTLGRPALRVVQDVEEDPSEIPPPGDHDSSTL